MFLGPIDKDIWPMIENDTAILFENYWQYRKIFRDMGHLDSENKVTTKWKNWRKKGYASTKGHRHPLGTKTTEVMYVDENGKNRYKYRKAISSMYGNERMGYIESRKKVYIPLYYKLLTKQPFFLALKKYIDDGGNIQILDYDAPYESQNVDIDMLIRTVNEDLPFGKPFGHGYVVAASLLGIEPEDYI